MLVQLHFMRGTPLMKLFDYYNNNASEGSFHLKNLKWWKVDLQENENWKSVNLSLSTDSLKLYRLWSKAARYDFFSENILLFLAKISWVTRLITRNRKLMPIISNETFYSFSKFYILWLDRGETTRETFAHLIFGAFYTWETPTRYCNSDFWNHVVQ